jgi:hypothetical protein
MELGAQSKRSVLIEGATRALAARRYGDAIEHILGLVALEPSEPRWQQKYGEVLRTLGRDREAAAAYRRAARRYEAQALPALASAAERVADSLDGGGPSLAERVLQQRQVTQPIARVDVPRPLAVTRPITRPDLQVTRPLTCPGERPTSRPPGA